MTVTIPEELVAELQAKAAQRNATVANLVREALEWYLRMDTELLDELAAWQDVRDEALEIVEGQSS